MPYDLPLDLVSCLLVRNRVQYAGEAARSLAAARERIPTGMNVRIIVVDHASGKEAAAEVSQIAARHGFEYQRYDDFLPVSRHWNRVVRSTDATWVHLNHDDDLIEPDFFSEFHALVVEFPEADAFACPYITMTSNRRMRGGTEWEWDQGIAVNSRDVIRTRCAIACTAFIFTRAIFEKADGYDEALDFTLDWKFYWDVVTLGLLVTTERALMRYRVHAGSVTESSGASDSSIDEDLVVSRYFAAQSGMLPDYGSAIGKLRLAGIAAAKRGELGTWLGLGRRMLGLSPSLKQVGKFIYTATGFFRAPSG